MQDLRALLHSQRPADVAIVPYNPELEDKYFVAIQRCIAKNLYTYSIDAYRLFLDKWPQLCHMAIDVKTERLCGVILARMEVNEADLRRPSRGYIGMLVVEGKYRGQGIATTLCRKATDEMRRQGADDVMLEADVKNAAAIAIYEKLGFARTRRLPRLYINGHDGFEMILGFKDSGRALEPKELVLQAPDGVPRKKPRWLRWF